MGALEWLCPVLVAFLWLPPYILPYTYICLLNLAIEPVLYNNIPVGILRKSISGRHRPVRVADGPMTARCRFT